MTMPSQSQPVRHHGAAVGRCGAVPPGRTIEERMQANQVALSASGCREVRCFAISL